MKQNTREYIYIYKYGETRKGNFQTVATKMETSFLYLYIVFPPLLQQFWSVWNDCTRMSLVFVIDVLRCGNHSISGIIK